MSQQRVKRGRCRDRSVGDLGGPLALRSSNKRCDRKALSTTDVQSLRLQDRKESMKEAKSN